MLIYLPAEPGKSGACRRGLSGSVRLYSLYLEPVSNLAAIRLQANL